MCVIIFKNKSTQITKADLMQAYERNPDGCGIADMTTGKCIKGLWSAKTLWREYRTRCDHDLLIHLRIATSGKIDQERCHPFLLKNGGILAHNGVISGLSNPKSDLSDTQILVGMLESCRTIELQLQVLQSHAGDNRFAFLDRKGKLHLLGKWEKYNGLSVSNLYSFCKPVAQTYPKTDYAQAYNLAPKACTGTQGNLARWRREYYSDYDNTDRLSNKAVKEAVKRLKDEETTQSIQDYLRDVPDFDSFE